MRIAGSIAAAWGILGVAGVLGFAVAKLLPAAVEAMDYDLGWTHWVALFAVAWFFLYLKGYRAFQKGFIPRVVERAAYLREQPSLLAGLLAPLYCIGYFGSSLRLKLAVYGVTLAVVAMVLSVRWLEQPWQGIVDAGVIAGLGWGVLVTLVLGGRMLRDRLR